MENLNEFLKKVRADKVAEENKRLWEKINTKSKEEIYSSLFESWGKFAPKCGVVRENA